MLSRLVRGLVSLLWVSLILAAESSRSVTGPSATTVLPALRRATAAQPHPGFTPSQIRHFYGIDRLPFDGQGQTIAVVGTGVSPTVGSDLAVFSQAYGLPQLNGVPRRPRCTVQNGPHPCFQHLASSGTSSYAARWAIETALGVEWAHAIAPGADILLVESPSGNLTDMLAAVDVAVRSGAHIVAMSWGAAEFAGERSYDQHFAVPGVAVRCRGWRDDAGSRPRCGRRWGNRLDWLGWGSEQIRAGAGISAPRGPGRLAWASAHSRRRLCRESPTGLFAVRVTMAVRRRWLVSSGWNQRWCTPVGGDHRACRSGQGASRGEQRSGVVAVLRGRGLQFVLP